MTHEEALSLARGELPWWVPWWPVVSIAAMWLLGAAIGRVGLALALARLRRTPADAHWTERARTATSARTIAAYAGASAMVASVLLGGSGLLAVLPSGWTTALGALAAIVGAGRMGRPLNDAIGMPRLARSGASSVVLVLLLYAALPFTALMAGVIWRLDLVSALLLWVLGALVLAGWLRGGSLWALRALGITTPAPARLTEIVARASEKVGMAPPRAWLLPMRVANAYALPFAGELAYTAPLVDTLDDEELEAITLHELGHLREPPRALLFRAARVALLYSLALAGIAFRQGPLWSLGLPLGVLVLALWARRMSVRLEQAADAVAHDHAEEGVYARALERLHEVNAMPAVTARARTHPHLYDRLVAAGVTPSYPRPQAPESPRVLGFVLVFATAIAALGLRFAIDVGAPPEVQLAASRDTSAFVAPLRESTPERALPFDVLALAAANGPHAMQSARGQLALDQAAAGRCSDARATIADGADPEIEGWVLRACPR